MMGTEVLSSFGNLQNELEEAKTSLKSVDENLKRLIGRDPSELPPRNNLKRPFPDDKGKHSFKSFNKSRNAAFENEEPVSKKRSNISVFKRLSDKVEDVAQFPQKSIISKIIVTNKEIPSREKAIDAQNSNEQCRARNRRMFGALLGTLQKFAQEETKLKPKEEKRAQLEKKIEEHEKQEKLEIKKERQELFVSRKKKQAEIKLIELKMMRAKEYASWEESLKPRMNFIKTKAKPPIYYAPRRFNNESKELLEGSRQEVEKLMEVKKQLIMSELQTIEERMKRNFEYKYGGRSQQASSETQGTQDQDENSDNSDHEEAFTETQIAAAKDAEAAANTEDGNKEEIKVEEHTSNKEASQSQVSENGTGNCIKNEAVSQYNADSGQQHLSDAENSSSRKDASLDNASTSVDTSVQLETNKQQEQ